MKEIELETTHREILGKKVRHLRHQNITPVHLFGHNVDSMSLQCDTDTLHRVLAQAGKTGLISLKLDKTKKPRSVLTREIQRNPITGELLHVDFYEVKATEKIKVQVPIILIGEASALKLKGNILVQELDSLGIECLPDKIPSRIDLDLSLLTGAEQTIRVKDITLGEGVTISHDDPELIVAKITVTPLEKEEEAVAGAAEAVPLTEEEPTEEK